jgi:hypothetical protein
MTKRKPPEWTERKKAAPRVKAPPEPDKKVQVGPNVVNLRCLWHTRLVVTANRTLSGKRYQFEPGEVKSVLAIDANRLLAMEKHQPPGCCGSESHPPVLKYFEPA